MRKTVLPAVLLLLTILGCVSKPSETAAGAEGTAVSGVRALVEQGTPSSLVEALEQIRSRAPETERVFVQVAASLLAGVYPDVPVPVLPPEAPSVYARILRDAERGVYVRPASSSQDFLEHVLPFLAFFHGGKTAIRNSLADLDKAAILNPKSALPPLLRGIACERSGDAAAAGEAFTLALALGADYQAELGLARLQHNSGDYDAELGRLVRLQNRYPQYISIKRQLALVYAQRGDNARAGALAAEVLARNPRDGEFLLLHARVLIDQGLFNQALAPLEAYAPIDSGGRQYLFLRARVQAEGYRNPDAALGYLRTLLRANAGDEEAAVYMAALLLESNKAEENAEGRSLLSRFLNRASIPPPVLALAVADSVRRESWREAKTYLDRLLVQSRSAANLLNAYKVERGLGNNAQALIYARELYNLEGNNNEEAVNAYVTALIETGRQSDAGRIIEQRLAAVSGGVLKSRYYYLRSRLRDGDDAIMNDLRSALFEDPRNVDALIAMFEIYHRRQDQRRAVYYLKQAVALAPGNAVLRRYEAEYRAALGTSY